MVLTREAWAAQRIAARYKQRGDTVTLRRLSVLPGPVSYPNPFISGSDVQIVTAIEDGETIFLGIRASSLSGRLIVGDQFVATAGSVRAVWTVLPMPNDIQTDEYGAQLADPSGLPVRGEPQIYNADSLAADNQLSVVPVEPDVAIADPSVFIGTTPSFVFLADEPIFVASLSAYAMTAMGWTEVDDIGLMMAGTRTDGTTIARPAVDDQVIIRGIARNIMTVNENSRRTATFLYNLRLK